jgi:hypothetical protein
LAGIKRRSALGAYPLPADIGELGRDARSLHVESARLHSVKVQSRSQANVSPEIP